MWKNNVFCFFNFTYLFIHSFLSETYFHDFGCKDLASMFCISKCFIYQSVSQLSKHQWVISQHLSSNSHLLVYSYIVIDNNTKNIFYYIKYKIINYLWKIICSWHLKLSHKLLQTFCICCCTSYCMFSVHMYTLFCFVFYKNEFLLKILLCFLLFILSQYIC